MILIAIVAIILVVAIVRHGRKKSVNKDSESGTESQEFDRTVIMDRAPVEDPEQTAFFWEKEEIKGKIELIEIGGSGSVYRKTIDSAIFIGKDESSCDVCIKYDKTISRRHCKIIRRGNEFFISDENSSNGTYVNDKRISSGPVELVTDDVIRLGRTQLRFQILE